MATFRLNKYGWVLLLILGVVLILYYFSDVGSIVHLRGNVVSVKQLLIRSVNVVEDAGSVIRSSRSSSELNTHIKSADEGAGSGPANELITNIDLKSHSIIMSGLSSEFPGLKIISEEHPPASANQPILSSPTGHSEVEALLPNADLFVPVSDLTVWVDPLDATQEFTEALWEYVTVMICVALHGNPIIGIIHQPFLNRTYWAWKSLYPMSKPTLSPVLLEAIANASRRHESSLRITHSRSHLKEADTKPIKDLFTPQPVEFIPAGGSGFKVLSLIQGDAQLYLHPASTRRWDICAAQAVLEAAGGRMTGLDGSPISYSAESPHKIDASTGLFATSSVTLYDRWKDKISKLSSNLHNSGK